MRISFRCNRWSLRWERTGYDKENDTLTVTLVLGDEFSVR